MSVVCQNPARPTHEIADGGRKITLTGVVVWGQADLRDDWTGDYVFCSFACLSEWAALRADDHDGVVLREGTAVEALQPDQVVALEAVRAVPTPPTPAPPPPPPPPPPPTSTAGR
jgi:hypothetical protein